MRLNTGTRTIIHGGVEYGPLSFNQWAIMEALANSDEPIQVENLSRIVYGSPYQDGGIRSIVNRIRNMAEEAGAPDPIITIPGHGYAINSGVDDIN